MCYFHIQQWEFIIKNFRRNLKTKILRWRNWCTNYKMTKFWKSTLCETKRAELHSHSTIASLWKLYRQTESQRFYLFFYSTPWRWGNPPELAFAMMESKSSYTNYICCNWNTATNSNVLLHIVRTKRWYNTIIVHCNWALVSIAYVFHRFYLTEWWICIQVH